MFAKLKKKLQEEASPTSGVLDEKPPLRSDAGVTVSPPKISDPAYIHNTATNQAVYQKSRHSRSSRSSESDQSGDKTPSNDTKTLNFADDIEELEDVSSKEELLEMLMKRTEQVRTCEAKLGELASLVREKNQNVEKLEAELERQQDTLCQRLQDLNEQYHDSRAKLSESIAAAVGEREAELRAEIRALEKTNERLEEACRSAETERDACRKRAEEKEASEIAANRELASLKALLSSQKRAEEIDRRGGDAVRESPAENDDRVEELLGQITLLTKRGSDWERKTADAESLVSDLRAANDETEKLLKESKDAYAQLAVQKNQDEDWLEKQIESENSISILEDEILNLKSELSEREKDAVNSTKRSGENAKELADCRSSIDGMVSEIETRRRRAEELERAAGELNRELSDARRETDVCVSRIEELSAELDAAKRTFEELSIELESVSKEKDRLESRLSEHEASVDGYEVQLSELRTQRRYETETAESETIVRLKQESEELKGLLQEKNRAMKKQELRLADLRKLLQRELRASGEDAAETNAAACFDRNNASVYVESSLQNYSSDERTSDAVAAFERAARSAATLPITHSITRNATNNVGKTAYEENLDARLHRISSKVSADDVVSVSRKYRRPVSTAFSPLSDPAAVVSDDFDLTTELNFKYLRHVVLKFMLSRESEALQLIKAISLLLKFTPDEQKLIHDTLEWKMSWFGSRPQLLMKGQDAKIIPPPSI